ncbi:hypothetical protein [Nocardia niwae]|uniref:hypothetical protein n=1 Tax=Nocardia niwae TaxID=626084 RepID=UPI0033FF510D
MLPVFPERNCLVSSSDDRSRPYKGGDSGAFSQVTTASTWANKPRHADTAAEFAEIVDRLNRDQLGGSWSLPLEDGASANVPVVSVRDWLPHVAPALDSEAGRAAVAKHQTSTETVLEHVRALAKFADLHTGRGITASTATMARRAGCSPGTMRKIRYVLRDLGLAKDMKTGRSLSSVEIAAARAHHGGFQTRAASVWHLTLPRPTAAVERPLTPRRKSASLGKLARGAHIAAAAAVSSPTSSTAPDAVAHRDDLSGHLSSRTEVREERSVGRSGFFHPSSLVGKKSPTRARSAHAGRRNPRKAGRKTWSDSVPHPLHRQLAAAELVAECYGIDHGQWMHLGSRQYLRLPGSWHIGALCNVLADLGIDTEYFGGRDIARRLTEYTTLWGIYWPTHYRNPIGFLRYLLTRVDWSQQVPLELAAVRRARHVRNAASPSCSLHPEASRRGDGECVMCFSDRMSPPDDLEGGAGTSTYTRPSTAGTTARAADGGSGCARTTAPSLSEELAAAAGDVCAVCSNPGHMRHEMPLPMAVCDECWETQWVNAESGQTANVA